jgi:predicted nucleic acid-binding protein
MTIVLDASAGIEVVLDRPRAKALRERIEEATKVISSDLYKAETANAIWKYVRAGFIPRRDADRLLELAQGLVDDFIDIAENNGEAMGEAIRTGHPAYDLLYMTLARRNGAVLLTLDGKLKKLAEKNGIQTEGS